MTSTSLSHPDPATLEMYHAGELPDGQTAPEFAAVHAHISTCAICQKRLGRMNALDSALQALPLMTPPRDVRAAIRQHAADLSAELTSSGPESIAPRRSAPIPTAGSGTSPDPAVRAGSSVGDGLKRIIAILRPSPAPRLELAGARGAPVNPQWHHTYTAADVRITLTLSKSTGAADAPRLSMKGLVSSTVLVAEELARAHVELRLTADAPPEQADQNDWASESSNGAEQRADQHPASSDRAHPDLVAVAELNEFGHFALEGIPAGVYTLQIVFANQMVVLPDLSLVV